MAYLDEARVMLDVEYSTSYKEALDDDYAKSFMDEKIKHSYQVLGAGNYLIAHEDCFCLLDDDIKDKLKATVLLHDIARFREILAIQCGDKLDHGIHGAMMLSNTDNFSSIDVLLPIKHHGHLIEFLYNDDEYIKLSDDKKEWVKKVSYLVRDADKIANFYLLVRAFDEMEKIFFVEDRFENPYNMKPSDNVVDSFMEFMAINRGDVKNFADQALMILAWIFDLNYKYSFVYLEKLKIIDKICDNFSKFFEKEDANMYKSLIKKYVQDKMA